MLVAKLRVAEVEMVPSLMSTLCTWAIGRRLAPYLLRQAALSIKYSCALTLNLSSILISTLSRILKGGKLIGLIVSGTSPVIDEQHHSSTLSTPGNAKISLADSAKITMNRIHFGKR